jgi:hypothetical protein
MRQVPWYDDIGVMTTHILSLEGLNRLINARYEAGYNRKERLNEWVVLGWLCMDTCGNTMRMDRKCSDSLVIPRNQVKRYVANMNCPVPQTNSICPYCGNGWDISNWYDVKITKHDKDIEGSHVGITIKQLQDEMNGNGLGKEYRIHEVVQNDKLIDLTPDPRYKDDDYVGGYPINRSGHKYVKIDYVIEEGDKLWVTIFEYYHLECISKYKAANEQEYFATIFDRAGYGQHVLTAIPNEYCKNITCCPPWYNVTTEIGEFTVGWRKRVIKLVWPKEFNVLHLFGGEDVTKESTYIHAWGTDKAVEYLKMIRKFILEG